MTGRRTSATDGERRVLRAEAEQVGADADDGADRQRELREWDLTLPEVSPDPATPHGEPVRPGIVEAVCRDSQHRFSKGAEEHIRLLAGLGVEGDAHLGRTVQHRSRVARDPSQPNLRQVHLIHGELHDELRAQGFDVAPGVMGENVTTRGVDLLALPTGSRLRLGADAVLEVTGLRNPCVQLDHFQEGLMAAVLDRDDDGNLVRKSGVMAIVVMGGDVQAGDAVAVELPRPPHVPLERV